MQLTVRNARRFNEELSQLISTLTGRMSSNVELSVFSAQPAEIADAIRLKQEQVIEDLQNVKTLIHLRNTLRSTIASKNVEAGISDLMTQLVSLESQLEAVNNMLVTVEHDTYRRRGAPASTPNNPVKIDFERLSAQLLAMGKTANSGQVSGAPTALTVSALTNELYTLLKQQHNQLKKQIAKTKDQLADLNVKTLVSLNISAVEQQLLKSNGITLE